ncbi:cell division protein FtsK [Amycolatopsis japonica]|uniref:cell division protein FtsK n=1 Tax=Amycolatopsis japonica TaxID=208439 RepID=UPI00366B7EFF
MNPTDHNGTPESTSETAAPVGELATVHPLRTRPDQHESTDSTGGESAPQVVEGRIISEYEYRLLTDEKAQREWRYAEYRKQAAWLARTTKTAVTHDRTVSTLKFIARHGTYVFTGGAIVAKRGWEAKTNSRYERLMRQAEARGKFEELSHWEERAEQAKAKRHERAMEWLDMPMKLLKALGVGVAALVVTLLLLGIVLAVGYKDIAMVAAPFETVIDVVMWVSIAVSVAWGPFLLAAPWIGAAALHRIGRRAEAHPSWLAPVSGAGSSANALITGDAIVKALQYLPIPRLKEAFKKEDWQPRFELTPVREGTGDFRGYRAIFDLPLGLNCEKIADHANVLARNLSRNAVEVWVGDYGKQKGGKAGYINLYVADSGVMDKPVPEYPLLNSGSVDVFEGVPLGITQRGDQVAPPMVGANAVFGGQPGQGKSNTVRAVFLGCALDPLCELRVHVFAKNGDFEEFAPRLSRYEKGANPAHVESALEHLRELYAEVERREDRLTELDAKKLTRAIAAKHPDMRPLGVGFSECHELFGHKQFGEEAGDLAVQVVKRGRKTGVFAVFDTQSARAGAIPSELVENVGINGCFSVKSWRSNDGFLGDGSFAAGIRATELRFNVDKGTMVTTGMTEELFEIVRTYFIEVNDDEGWDQATGVIARAMEQLDPATPVSGSRPAAQLEPADRDLLADLVEVLPRDEAIPAAKVAPLLVQLDAVVYDGLNGQKLRALLADEGVKVPSSKNLWPIDSTTIRHRIAERGTTPSLDG